jgi:adenylate cyclase
MTIFATLLRASERMNWPAKQYTLTPLPLAHAILGDVLACKQQFEASMASFARAFALNPNFTHYYYATALIFAGEPARAIEIVEAHTRLDPFPKPLAPFLLGTALYMLKQYSQAVSPLRESVLRRPNFMLGHMVLAATYAQLGQLEEARAEAGEVLRILPTYTIATMSLGLIKHRADAEHFGDGLRKAGLG